MIGYYDEETEAFAKLLNERKPADRVYILDALKQKTPFCWHCGGDDDENSWRGCQCRNDD